MRDAHLSSDSEDIAFSAICIISQTVQLTSLRLVVLSTSQNISVSNHTLGSLEHRPQASVMSGFIPDTSRQTVSDRVGSVLREQDSEKS